MLPFFFNREAVAGDSPAGRPSGVVVSGCAETRSAKRQTLG